MYLTKFWSETSDKRTIQFSLSALPSWPFLEQGAAPTKARTRPTAYAVAGPSSRVVASPSSPPTPTYWLVVTGSRSRQVVTESAPSLQPIVVADAKAVARRGYLVPLVCVHAQTKIKSKLTTIIWLNKHIKNKFLCQESALGSWFRLTAWGRTYLKVICKVDKTFIQYHAATWTVLKRVTEKSEAEQKHKKSWDWDLPV